MDIPLQKTFTAPMAAMQRSPIGAVEKTSVLQMQSKTPHHITQPPKIGEVEKVNVARLAAQSPQIPTIIATERVLKPYGVSMLPSSETSEKLAHYTA